MSKISYNLTTIKAVVFDVDGVLSPSTIPLGADGVPTRMVNIKDGYALQLAVKKGLKIAIITGADSPAIVKRFNSLGITDVFTKVSEKLPLLKKWMDDNALFPTQVAYVGDDIPDIQCMKSVALAIAPADAAIDIKAIAGYISPAQGGYGVARDVIEEILKAKNQWMSSADAFGW